MTSGIPLYVMLSFVNCRKFIYYFVFVSIFYHYRFINVKFLSNLNLYIIFFTVLIKSVYYSILFLNCKDALYDVHLYNFCIDNFRFERTIFSILFRIVMTTVQQCQKFFIESYNLIMPQSKQQSKTFPASSLF